MTLELCQLARDELYVCSEPAAWSIRTHFEQMATQTHFFCAEHVHEHVDWVVRNEPTVTKLEVVTINEGT